VVDGVAGSDRLPSPLGVPGELALAGEGNPLRGLLAALGADVLAVLAPGIHQLGDLQPERTAKLATTTAIPR
jgi:hypothetical protein